METGNARFVGENCVCVCENVGGSCLRSLNVHWVIIACPLQPQTSVFGWERREWMDIMLNIPPRLST